MQKYNLFELLTHLMACPDLFLKPSSFLKSGGLNSIALLSDTYRFIMGDLFQKKYLLNDDKLLKNLDENHWGAIHISIWLLSHKNFAYQPEVAEHLNQFWFDELKLASNFVPFKNWIDDEERAEEMVRLLLNCCEIIPESESAEEAADKLESISSADRQKVLAESNAANERIMKIKREMAEKKAREAANTYSRE